MNLEVVRSTRNKETALDTSMRYGYGPNPRPLEASYLPTNPVRAALGSGLIGVYQYDHRRLNASDDLPLTQGALPIDFS